MATQLDPQSSKAIPIYDQDVFWCRFSSWRFRGAGSLPDSEVKGTAILFLIWLTLAGFYWVRGAITPLVALGVGYAAMALLTRSCFCLWPTSSGTIPSSWHSSSYLSPGESFSV